MRIVQILCEDDVKVEWAVLEFQGEIKGISPGEDVGNIKIQSDGTAEFDIGQHRLQGKVETLPQPFVVMEKGMTDNGCDDRSGGSLMLMKGIVYKRIIFKSRPKPFKEK